METLLPENLKPPLNIIKVIDDNSVDLLKKFILNNKISGFDVETTVTDDFYWRRARTVQIGTTTEQYVIDLLAFCDGNSELLYNCQGDFGKNLHLAPRLEKLLAWLQLNYFGDSHLKVGVYLGFDYQTINWNFGIRSWNFYSCDMADRAIYAGMHSLKDYGYFSMNSMFERYFNKSIDKTQQKSFNLNDPITDEQWVYCALDTRLPLGIRLKQLSILKEKNLEKVVSIENNAIGAFEDMYLNGERLNIEKWTKITKEKTNLLTEIVAKLDDIFIPWVGLKTTNVVAEEDVTKAKDIWKSYDQVTQEELDLKAEYMARRKRKDNSWQDVKNQLDILKANRAANKKIYGEKYKELSKKYTVDKHFVPTCEGRALMNYASNPQLLELLTTHIPELKKIKDTNDGTLERFKEIPVVALLRDYRELAKLVSTYGMSWVRVWQNKPCAEEGWLHPGDGRLHSKFNQWDAETGRSTSEKPNGQNITQDPERRACFEADPPDEIAPEGYCIITADMNGAELRIIADGANARSWVDAFNRDEDVHSVGTELLFPHEWPTLTAKPGELDKKGKPLPECAYFKKHPERKEYDVLGQHYLINVGDPQRQKCDCPRHKKMRDGNKSTNFLVAYDLEESVPNTLSARTGMPLEEATELINKHKSQFSDIWAYLNQLGKSAKSTFEARTRFGRRRLFRKPDWERSKEYARERYWAKLKFSDAICKKRLEDFELQNGRKPTAKERGDLTHGQPQDKWILSTMKGLFNSIERQGKNHPIQGENADIVKIAMGWGFDEKENKPFLWHTLRKYNAKLLKLVHDELVVQCPKRFGKEVAELIGDAFRRAAGERFKYLEMKFDYKIADHWKK